MGVAAPPWVTPAGCALWTGATGRPRRRVRVGQGGQRGRLHQGFRLQHRLGTPPGPPRRRRPAPSRERRGALDT